MNAFKIGTQFIHKKSGKLFYYNGGHERLTAHRNQHYFRQTKTGYYLSMFTDLNLSKSQTKDYILSTFRIPYVTQTPLYKAIYGTEVPDGETK